MCVSLCVCVLHGDYVVYWLWMQLWSWAAVCRSICQSDSATLTSVSDLSCFLSLLLSFSLRHQPPHPTPDITFSDFSLSLFLFTQAEWKSVQPHFSPLTHPLCLILCFICLQQRSLPGKVFMLWNALHRITHIAHAILRREPPVFFFLPVFN